MNTLNKTTYNFRNRVPKRIKGSDTLVDPNLGLLGSNPNPDKVEQNPWSQPIELNCQSLISAQVQRTRLWKVVPKSWSHKKFHFSKEEKQRNSAVNQLIEKRLKELEDIGIEEDLPMSEDSKVELLAFIQKLVPLVYPSIFMSDEGTLQSVWQHEDGRQLGLLFFGTGEIEYSIFGKRKSDGTRSIEYGTTSVEKTYDIINRPALKVLYNV